MTEIQWLECTNPHAMLDYLTDCDDHRRFRLFACGCSRHAALKWTGESGATFIEIAEKYADGQATKEEVNRQRESVRSLLGSFRRHEQEGRSWYSIITQLASESFTAMSANGVYFTCKTIKAFERGPDGSHIQEGRGFANIIRDIFGNPFRPSTIDPAWLTWNNRTVPKLAQTIYDDRRYDIMPILGDALEDAGCNDEQMLEHCRGPGPHVRGCWVVDLILGKK
jgi:hypothetical protein